MTLSEAIQMASGGQRLTRDEWRGSFLHVENGEVWIRDEGDLRPQPFEPDDVEMCATNYRVWTREDIR